MTKPPRAGCRPSRYERDILDFAILWLPYGGPRPSDVLEQFGMTPIRFGNVVYQLLETRSVDDIDPQVSDELRRRFFGCAHGGDATL